MANELKFGNKVVFLNGLPLTLPVAASDPGSATAGDLYYNSGSTTVRYYNGSSWADLATGGAAANTALSNLASVAVNVSLLPGVDNSINLGSAAKSWAAAWIHVLNDASNVASVDAYNRLLKDAAGLSSVDFAGRLLIDAAAATKLSWDSTGVKFNGLTASTVPYLDASKYLVSSAVTPTELGYLSGVTSAIQTQLNAKAADNIVIKKDGSVTYTANQPMGGFKLTGLAAGSGAGDSVRYEQAILASGVNAWTANQSLGGFKITNSADPSSAQDLATKAYVDAVAQGLKPKTAVRAATLVNGTLATAFANGSVIDGVTLATGNRILIKNQTSTADNGIYIVQASGAPVRAPDFDSLSPIDEINGAYTFIQEGTQAGQGWVETGTVTVIGTDPIVFVYFNDASSIIGGDMILKTGNTLSVDLLTNGGLKSSNPGNVAGQLQISLEASAPSLAVNGSNELGIATGGITNTHVAAAAAIALTKLAALNNNIVPITNGSGFLTSSSVTATELGYLSGVTSAIQTQLNGKATIALDNLASVAINASLIAGADATLDLGSSSLQWNNLFVKTKIESNAAAGGLGTGFFIQSKNVTGAVNSANVNLVAGTVDTSGQTSGAAVIRSADCSVAGTNSGSAAIRSGDITAATGAGISGAVVIRSGNSTAGASGTTGAITMNTGNALTNNTGAITARSGTVSTGTSGDASFGSGNASGAGTSGNATFSAGTVSGGTRGHVGVFGSDVTLGGGTIFHTSDILPGAGTFPSTAGSDNTRNLGSGAFNYVSVNSKALTSSTVLALAAGSGDMTLSASTGIVRYASDNTGNLGTSSFRFASVSSLAVDAGASALSLLGTGSVDVKATKFRRSESSASSNFVEDQYLDAITLAANTSSATEISASLSFALASYDAAIIEYRIKEATSNKNRVGQFIVTTDGTIASSSDQFTESAVLGSALGLQLSADISGGNVRILFNNTHATNACVMRASIRRLRA